MPTQPSQRWFSKEQVQTAAEQLMAEVTEAGLSNPTSTDQRYHTRRINAMNRQTCWFLGLVGLLITAVLFIPNLLPGEWLAKTENLNLVVSIIVIAVPIGFGVAAKQRLARASQRFEKHDTCIEQLVDQFPELCSTHSSAINSTSVDILPLMETGAKDATLRCGLFGKYRGHAVALLEAEYLSPRGIDAAELVARAHAEFVGDVDREQFSRTRSGEAIVFFEPLDQLPDILIGGREEPLHAYQQKWIQKTGNQPGPFEINLGEKFRGFCSNPSGAVQVLSDEFCEILKLRPQAMVQAIGGYVVVIPRTWSAATPMGMAVTPFEIQLDLDFSSALYEQLVVANRVSPTQRPSAC